MDGRKSELISANDYYQNIEPVDADEITTEETLSYSFGPFGAPAKARMTLARSKTSSFAFNSSPMERCPGSPEITASLVMAQIACIQQGGCVSIPVSPELSAYLNSPSATPEASPVPCTGQEHGTTLGTGHWKSVVHRWLHCPGPGVETTGLRRLGAFPDSRYILQLWCRKHPA